jgi:opacity protein-like surface antigen
MPRSALLLTAVFLILASGIASAQSDVSLNVTGNFANTVNGKGIEETATKSGGVLFSFRHFSHHNGFEANYGYTKNSQKYSDQLGNSVASIQSSIHELTAAYVWRATRGAVQPFALAGGGFLMFSPTSSATDAAVPKISRNTRPAFLYGAVIDVAVSKKAALRAQYRGLIYEAPDFFGGAVAIHTSTAMRTSEPSIGIVYRF